MNNTATITLAGKEYNGKLDFLTLARVQSACFKEGYRLTTEEIFKEAQQENLTVILEIVIQSILRMYPQIKRYQIEDKLSLEEFGTVVSFLEELFETSLPKEEEAEEVQG